MAVKWSQSPTIIIITGKIKRFSGAAGWGNQNGIIPRLELTPMGSCHPLYLPISQLQYHRKSRE